MAVKGDPQPRFGGRHYENETERLCGYIKNDSLVRWATGCTQAEVTEARAAIARRGRPRGSYTPKLRPCDDTGQDDMPRRRALAADSNARYLEALRQAHG